MGEIAETPAAGAQSITAVALDKSKSSMYALKWAVEKLVHPDGSLHLLHVYAPIKNVPTPMGIRSVDQVRPEIAEKFREQQMFDINFFMNKFEGYCKDKKVKPITCLLENESVSKTLVNQISKLSISRLVIGHTSRNKLAMAFSGPAKSDYVAKHAPAFCAIMVVNKNKLVSVRDANQSISPRSSLSLSDRNSTGSDTPGRDNSMGLGGLWREWASTSSNSNTPVLTAMDSMDLRQKRLASRSTGHSVPDGNIGDAILLSPQTSGDKTPSSSSSQVDGVDHFITISPLVDTLEVMADNLSIDNNSVGHPSLSPDSYGYTKRGINSKRSYPPLIEIGGSLANSAEPQSEDEEAGTAPKAGGMAAVSEIETLQQQLDAAMKEMERQSIRLQRAEKALASAMSMVEEYGAQRKEEAHLKEAALKKLDFVKQQYIVEKKRREEIAMILEETKLDAEVNRTLADEERQRCEEAVASLERSEKEAEMDRQRVVAILAELEETRRALATEVRLRSEAEEKARQEVLSKQEIATALRRAQKYSVYSFEELQNATDGFSDDLKLGEGGYGCVYKGAIHYTDVAIKVLRQDGLQGQREFQREVELLSRIRHPHLVMLVGACPENACIVYEYMANGSLEQCLSQRRSANPLPWFIRFRVCYEVALALMFLHSSHPEPIIHRDLKPGNILLDHNFVCKISDVGLARLIPNNMTFNTTRCRDTVPVGTFAYIDPDYQRTGVFGPHSDVYSLGIVILQILTGKQPIGVTDLVEDALDDNDIYRVLDTSAGDWPVQEATELARLGLRCAEPRRKQRMDLNRVLSSLKEIQKVGEAEAANEVIWRSSGGQEIVIPTLYICPISQEVMEDPYIAGDGFTYEYQYIKDWLFDHDTSPMTNLALAHKNLTPNHSLRSAIREWQSKSSGH